MCMTAEENSIRIMVARFAHMALDGAIHLAEKKPEAFDADCLDK